MTIRRFIDEPVRTNTPNCPNCGQHMVRRKSQHGIFWGCSSYPDCNGTRDSLGESPEENEDDKEDEPKWKRRYE